MDPINAPDRDWNNNCILLITSEDFISTISNMKTPNSSNIPLTRENLLSMETATIYSLPIPER